MILNKAGSKLENRLTHTNRKMRYFFQSQYTTLKDVSIPKVVQERCERRLSGGTIIEDALMYPLCKYFRFELVKGSWDSAGIDKMTNRGPFKLGSGFF